MLTNDSDTTNPQDKTNHLAEDLLRRLEQYKKQQRISWAEVSRRMNLRHNVTLHRWRKRGVISPAYQRIVLGFLDDEETRNLTRY